MDAHAGFRLITDAIGRRDRRTLIWLVGGITFCMSAVLDNLTSTIVMVSMLRKLEKVPAQRKYLGAVVVVAANAGGASRLAPGAPGWPPDTHCAAQARGRPSAT